MSNEHNVTGSLVKLTIDTQQALALDAVIGLMQAGFAAAKEAGKLEEIVNVKDFDQKFLGLLAVDVFLNVADAAFNELDPNTLDKDEHGNPLATVEVETDDFTALSIYNVCGLAEDKDDILKEFEGQAKGLKFSVLSSLKSQMIKLLDIKPNDRPTTSFQAPSSKKPEYLN